MSLAEKFIEAIRIASESDPDFYPLFATVDSVDTTNMTCYCIPIDETLPDYSVVKLMTTPDKGFFLIPKKDSQVIVQPMKGGAAMVLMYSELDGIQMLGDNYGGLIKISDLVNKLNNLENKVNDLINTFNAHTHPYMNATTPATTSPSTTPISGNLTPTTTNDIENPLIKHGSGN